MDENMVSGSKVNLVLYTKISLIQPYGGCMWCTGVPCRLVQAACSNQWQPASYMDLHGSPNICMSVHLFGSDKRTGCSLCSDLCIRPTQMYTLYTDAPRELFRSMQMDAVIDLKRLPAWVCTAWMKTALHNHTGEKNTRGPQLRSHASILAKWQLWHHIFKTTCTNLNLVRLRC